MKYLKTAKGQISRNVRNIKMKMKSIVQILLAIKITGGWDETEVVFLMYIYIYIFFFVMRNILQKYIV